jgi:polyisoprenoid-binding protein YceI
MVTPLSGILLCTLAAPVTYELDAKATELLAFTRPEGLKTAAHPHVLQAQQVKGTMVYDDEHPERSSVRVGFPTDWLVNDDSALRQREHLSPMSDSQRASVAANMRGEDQLDPKRFPSIDFESTGVKKLDDGRLEVTGTLGIRGVRKQLTLPVSVSVKDGVLRGEGSTVIKHSDFNFLPYTAALGLIRNADEITLRLLLVGRSKAPPAPDSLARDAGRAPGG